MLKVGFPKTNVTKQFSKHTHHSLQLKSRQSILHSNHNLHVFFGLGYVKKFVKQVWQPKSKVASTVLSPTCFSHSKTLLFSKPVNKKLVYSVSDFLKLNQCKMNESVLMFDDCYVSKFSRPIFKWVPKGSRVA